MAKMLACPATFNFANKFFGTYALIVPRWNNNVII